MADRADTMGASLDLEAIRKRCDALNEFGLMGNDGFPLAAVYEAIATDVPALIAEVERLRAECERRGALWADAEARLLGSVAVDDGTHVPPGVVTIGDVEALEAAAQSERMTSRGRAEVRECNAAFFEDLAERLRAALASGGQPEQRIEGVAVGTLNGRHFAFHRDGETFATGGAPIMRATLIILESV